MGAVEFQLPLLKLPERAKKYVFKKMPIVDQTTYSFISKSTKNSIASLEINSSLRIIINISSNICIQVSRSPNQPLILFRIFNKESDQITPESTVLPIPKAIEISTILNGIRQTSRMSNYKEFGLKQYLEHFLDIFPTEDSLALNKTIVAFLSSEREIFPSDLLYDAFKGLDIKAIDIKTRFYEQLIKKLLPRTPDCAIHHENPFSNEYLPSVFIQNFSRLSYYREITLDDLLMVNSSGFDGVASFNESHLNRFLKCWAKGSNPRLKGLRVQIIRPRPQLNLNLVLRGIRHTIATEEEMRERGQWQKLIWPSDVAGQAFGWNIRRITDGQEATVAFITHVRYCAMYLFVEDQ